jgi:hypothetical protein
LEAAQLGGLICLHANRNWENKPRTCRATSGVGPTHDDIVQYPKDRRARRIFGNWLLGRISPFPTLQGLANLDIESPALSKTCHQQARRLVKPVTGGDIRTVHTCLLIRWGGDHCRINCGNFAYWRTGRID